MADITDTPEGEAVENAWLYLVTEYSVLMPEYWDEIDTINNSE